LRFDQSFNNVVSVPFDRRNRPLSIYEIVEKIKNHGHVFLSLRHAGQSGPATVTIVFPSMNNESFAKDLGIGDKIEYTSLKCVQFGYELRQSFFENENPSVLVSAIKAWGSNVVPLRGWKKLSQKQTKFVPRMF